MPIDNAKDLFVMLLSDLRQGAERTTNIFKDLSEATQDPKLKELLEARVFLSDKILASLDECFKLIGTKPVNHNGRLRDVFLEDFRKDLSQIRSTDAKRLFILVRATHLIHLRIGEYVALIAAADLSDHQGVGVLLESCLADKLAFVEQTRRLIRENYHELTAA
jgi:ferritin-like metal-binding protein YciE